jgi:hypothetical protein
MMMRSSQCKPKATSHQGHHSPDHQRQLRVQQAIFQAYDGQAAGQCLSMLWVLQQLQRDPAQGARTSKNTNLQGFRARMRTCTGSANHGADTCADWQVLAQRLAT